MADNSITFDINLNDRPAEKDLVRIQNKINDMNKKLDDAKAKKPALEEKVKRLGAALDGAWEKLQKMKLAEEGVFSPREIEGQTNLVNGFKKMYEDAKDDLAENEAIIKKIPEDLKFAEEAAEGVVAQIKAANSPTIKMAGEIKKAKKHIDGIGKRINGLIRRVLLFSVIARGLNAFKNWMADTIKTSPEATEAIARLKGALLTLVQPLVNLIIPAFIKFVNTLAALITRIAELLARLFGSTLSNAQAQAKALNNQKKAISGVGKAAKKASKQLAAFDELNILSDPDSASGGGGGGAIEPIFDDSNVDLSKYDKLLKTIRLIGEALLAWKISNALGLGLKGFIGALLVIDGLVNGVKALFDIFQNGTSWENITKLSLALLEVGAGIALIVGGWLPLLIAGIAAAVLIIMQFGGTANLFFQDLKDAFGGLITFIKGVFTGDLKMALDGICKLNDGLINSILAVFGGFVNAIIKGLNWLIEKFNSKIAPIAAVTGRNISIPTIPTWTVPQLATGSVVPPNREFMAMLGDNKKETEVVSPLSTMKQAMVDAMNEAGFGNQKIEVYIGGEKFNSFIAKQQRNLARASGR